MVDELQVAGHAAQGLVAAAGLPQEHGEVVAAAGQPLRPPCAGFLPPGTHSNHRQDAGRV